MLPYVRSRNQNQRQDLVRSDNDFDLNFPLGFASPWQMMRRMQEDMDRVFGQFMDPRSGIPPRIAGQALQTWAPHMDVSETEQEYRIEADLPGVRPEDIDIQVQDGVLTLRAQMQQQDEQPQPTQQQTSQGQSQASQSQNQNASPQAGQEHVSRNQERTGQKRDGQPAQTGDQTNQSQRRYYQRERRFGYFERMMSLPPNADEEHIQAEFKDGVLTLHIPKQQQAQQSRRIQIQGGQSAASAGTPGSAQVTSGQGAGNQAQATAGAGNQQPATAGAQTNR
ncbi:MAG: heat shock protein-like protein [Chthonomonadaceae bacterium]|nr:heat shock protein-like protein [Chthonomonadaceae bacterium]